MKKYTKPTIEITNFRTNESIAASEYTEGVGATTAVTVFDISSASWNGSIPSN